MTDQREDVKDVRIRIEDSVVNYGSGYDIGPKLTRCTGVMHNWVDKNGVPSFPFGHVDVPSQTFIPLIPVPKDPDGLGIWYNLPGSTKYLLGAKRLSNKAGTVYDMETGLEIPGLFLGTTISSAWSFAFAGNINFPTTFVTAAGIINKAKINDFGLGLELNPYTPIPFNPDGQPDFELRPRIFYYHLNRLFMVYQSTVTKRSLAFYSDPFNLDFIRGTNFIDIPDLCNAVFRASASDVDIGSIPHLFFGCREGIYVLDGDPNLGNASFRQLKRSFGIFNLHHHVEVSGGVCILATDGRIHFVASGSFEPIPISESVRQKFSYLNPKLFLAWRAPYLYVLDAALGDIWIADLSGLPNNVYWTGPHRSQTDGLLNPLPFGMITGHPYDNNIVIPLGDTSTQIAEFFPSTNGIMETGYIYEPMKDIVCKRMRFKFRQGLVDMTFTARITNNDGQTDTRDFTIPGRADATSNTVAHALIVFDPDTVSFGKFFFCELSGFDLAYIIDWNIEYRIQGRKE